MLTSRNVLSASTLASFKVENTAGEGLDIGITDSSIVLEGAGYVVGEFNSGLMHFGGR